MARTIVKKDEGPPSKRGGGGSERPPRRPGGLAVRDKDRDKGRGDEESSVSPAERYQGLYAEIRKYLKAVQGEAKRVSWPTQQQMKAYVAVVLFTLIVVTGYLFICDVFFTKVFAWVITLLQHHPAAASQP